MQARRLSALARWHDLSQDWQWMTMTATEVLSHWLRCYSLTEALSVQARLCNSRMRTENSSALRRLAAVMQTSS